MTGIQIHDQREKDGVSHTNEDIDWTKTSENVTLVEQQERFRTVVSNRIAELELKRKPRSDATVMCQCLVTSDNAFFEKMSRQEQTEYFKKSLEFIKDRYGEQNLVSATIHYDERTPHMHVNFVPVTKDGRLSAKDLFSPKSLRELQDDYNRFVRENGYKLQRGEIDSKKKHLELEEYKIETKYKELKAKETELERLEKIDKVVGLDAEKGKLTYSTKEVEAIKEQNKSLKIELHKQDNEIQDLKRTLAKVEKTLIKTEKALEGTEQPLERLKDLESENRALQELRKLNPKIDKSLESFDKAKEYSYTLGEKMAKCKEMYHNTLDEREKLITRSSSCERIFQDYDNKSKELKILQKQIADSWKKEDDLEVELDGYKGIFKKKAREDCQNRLNEQKSKSEQLVNKLKTEYDTSPESINLKLQECENMKTYYAKEKLDVMDQTNQKENLSKQIIYTYKYHKALSDTQQSDLREISNRIDGKIKLRPGENKTFRLTQEDRKQLLKEFESKVPEKTFEKCKQNFIRQDKQERQERGKSRTSSEWKPQKYTQTKSQDWGMER